MRLKDEKFYKTVRDFLDIYLIRHKGYSANTQKSYREALNLLLLYFKTELGLEYVNIGFEDITYSNITGFLEWLSSSRNCSPATINLRLMAIRSFTKYAGILDPAKIHTQVEISNISIRKMPGKVVEFLSIPALNTLMEQPNRLKANGYRDFCFMKLMYDTAARCRELVNAKIGDLDLRKLVDINLFEAAAEKRQTKQRLPERTPAQKALKRVCSKLSTPEIEQQVTHLLGKLAEQPERIMQPERTSKPAYTNMQAGAHHAARKTADTDTQHHANRAG